MQTKILNLCIINWLYGFEHWFKKVKHKAGSFDEIYFIAFNWVGRTKYDAYPWTKVPHAFCSPIVIADCCGISMAISFRLWTYLTRSRTGMRTLTPGSRTLWNFPIRSTTHASCCGTNMTTVFNGVLWRHLTGARWGRAALNCSWPRTDNVWKQFTSWISQSASSQ